MSASIRGDQLVAIGFKPGAIVGSILKKIKEFPHQPENEMLGFITRLREYPENFLDDETWGDIARRLALESAPKANDLVPLVASPAEFAIFGSKYIEQGAIDQMKTAMKLPVAVAGALMPDAHQGYGLPIGGVLATRNSVIPYGVGVDIGCRMALSITDIPVEYFLNNQHLFKKELVKHTKFGAGNGFRSRDQTEHQVLDNPVFKTIPFLGNLKDKAVEQLGSSGGGNHFAEWGILEFPVSTTALSITAGKYVAFLTHSGSRGLGATIASHYTKLAKQICQLPKEAVNLAFLDLDAEAGHQYWMAMTLAGEYASACHEVIHNKILKSAGGQLINKVENHHNFAWKELHNGEQLVVHRKGATPAGKDVLGIIPGSMTAPGYLVSGKGNSLSLQSASHGAGRQMSRTQAIKHFSRQQMIERLKEAGVTLIGAGLDEAPMAYKDIHKVMESQVELVDLLASFQPVLVRMADDGSRED